MLAKTIGKTVLKVQQTKAEDEHSILSKLSNRRGVSSFSPLQRSALECEESRICHVEKYHRLLLILPHFSKDTVSAL